MTDHDARSVSRSIVARWRDLRSRPADADARSVMIVASYTANPLEAPVGVGLHDRDGAVPTLGLADYNQVFQVCLDPTGHHVDHVDDVVILWRIEDVFERDFHAWTNLDDAA